MPISARLRTAAELIAFPRIADIGTDHAFLPIYAVERGLADAAVACDLSPGSLAKAGRNIAAAGLSGKIRTGLGDGLEPLVLGEAQCAVLAGMGGHLMIGILRRSPEITAGLSQIILQPQNDVPFVRRAVHAMDMLIADEKIVRDRGKYYNILDCRPGTINGPEDGAGRPYGDAGYEFGRLPIDRNDPVLREYLCVTIRKNGDILEKIRSGGSGGAAARVSELQRITALAREALACMPT